MAEDLRSETVAALARVRTEADIVDVIREHTPTPAELAAAGELLADQARRELELAGHPMEAPASVYDLTGAELEVLAAVYSVLGPLVKAPGLAYRRLGDVLKILPPDVMSDVLRILRFGNFIPANDALE